MASGCGEGGVADESQARHVLLKPTEQWFIEFRGEARRFAQIHKGGASIMKKESDSLKVA